MIEGRMIKLGKHPFGYAVVCLKADGKKKMERIHRLVALAFIPNPMHLPCINHLDNDPANNHYTNLEWCDQKHNMSYASKQGRMYNREAGLTWEKVAIIRARRAKGEKLKDIAKDFGVNHTNISHICNNLTWKI